MLQQWATEVFSATGNHRHMIGMHASGFDVRLYFYDRAGVVYTRVLRIDEDQDAALFVRAVLRLTLASPLTLGLDPFFMPHPRCPYHFPIRQPPPGYESPWNSLSTPVGAVIQVEGVNFIVEDLIMSTGSLYGRGTTILGVRPAASPDAPEGPYLSSPWAGIRNRRVHAESQGVPPVDERLILKLAWQVPSRQSEEELLRLAQEKGVEGVIRLYKSATLERLSRGYRGRLVPRKMYVDRELRVQVLGPRCIPLKRVGNIEDFKEAFRSLVRGQLWPSPTSFAIRELTLSIS